MNQNLLPIVLLFLILVGGGYWLLNSSIKIPQSTPLVSFNTNFNTNIENKLIGKNPPLGNPTAPVKIIVFSDFQCFFCKKFYFESVKNIQRDYINKGLAVLYYRDFAILGDESINAAIASKCAREDGKYWEYVDLLYSSNQGVENIGNFSKENLLKIAEKLGLNKDNFKNCLESRKYIQEIQEDINAAIQLKARGTPYIVINNDIIEGAYPYSEFQKIINKYLQ